MKTILLLMLSLIPQIVFSQFIRTDSLHKIPFDTNRIAESVILSGNSDKFRYDSLYIWSDKRSLSEVMDMREGFFVFDYGLGGRNDMNYNGKSYEEVGVFRDGIQMNDNFFRGIDIQNMSVNEIQSVEEISNVSSFFYGINSFGKAINVISKDYFQPKPFSQLRYSQDRFGSLFADIIFSEPISRKFGVQLGITKHSLEGRYANSDFNVWRGRARLNFFQSPKFNAKLNFYLDDFDRGLNGGLVYSASADTLSDPSLASVVSNSISEHNRNYYYDATLTGRFFRNRNSITRLKLYSSNLLRHLNNKEAALRYYDQTGFNHSVQYSGDFSQDIEIIHNRNSSSLISAGGNFYLNNFSSSYADSYSQNIFSAKGKYDFRYKSFFVSALMRNDVISGTNYFSYGAETSMTFLNEKDFRAKAGAGISRSAYLLKNEEDTHYTFDAASRENPRRYYEFSASLGYRQLSADAVYYSTDYLNSDSSVSGYNVSLFLNTKHLDANVMLSKSEGVFSDYFVKSDISYKGAFFRNKLNLRIGIISKYYDIANTVSHYQSNYTYSITGVSNFPQKNQFIADAYLGARIGKANISLTVANIFNSLVYNSYIFPLDDRSGFLNSISRFTIVWDFIN